MFIPDSCFYQGSTHPVCQDYASTITSPRLSVAAISDGCSSITENIDGREVTRPNPHSDIGARILTLGALATIQRNIGANAYRYYEDPLTPANDAFGDLIIMAANASLQGFPGMDVKTLDATLGLLIAADTPASLQSEQSLVRCFLWGDGAIIHRAANGEVTVWYQEYQSGAPFYLSYRLSAGRMALYEATQKKPLIETRGTFNGALPSPDYDDNQQRSRHYAEAVGLDLTLAPGDTAMICSDGLGSFCSDKGPVNWREIIPILTDFKRFSGDYLKARMTFAIRQWTKLGYKHADDFSVAAIHNDGKAQPS